MSNLASILSPHALWSKSKSSKRRCSQTSLALEHSFKLPDMEPENLPQRRKRKRRQTDDDCLSVQSLDMSIKEPSKRRCSLTKMASLANMLSPIKSVKMVSHTLQKSVSFKNLLSPSKSHQGNNTPYKAPQPSKHSIRPYAFWSDTVKDDVREKCSRAEIDRQEAIFELYKGEDDLIEDLKMVKTTYHDSMKKLGLMTEEELDKVFGSIDTLVPLHEELKEQLQKERQPDGTTTGVGQILIHWVPKLKCYVPYCANQVYARDMLDQKKQDPAIEDFLQRCQESPFSRKLDLWSFLDVPRSKLVKYPLLIKAILKQTSVKHEDKTLLQQAIDEIDKIVDEVDIKAGESRCRLIVSKLDYLEDKQKDESIEQSKTLLCDGVLKTNRGTKVTVYLLDRVLILTRPSHRCGSLTYQVYRQPIPVSELVVEDLKDGEGKMGSFRTAFSQEKTGKNMFRVSFRDSQKGQSHTLMANDEHNKKQWLQCLQRVLPEPTDSVAPTE